MENGNSSSATVAPTQSTELEMPHFIMGPDMGIIEAVENLVNQHNIHYWSVSFGEHFIKEMVMNSVFGIPISPKVKSIWLWCTLCITILTYIDHYKLCCGIQL